MLRIFQVNDHTALADIRAWVAVADHRAQLITVGLPPQVEYQVVVAARPDILDTRDLAQVFLQAHQDSVTEIQFPR